MHLRGAHFVARNGLANSRRQEFWAKKVRVEVMS